MLDAGVHRTKPVGEQPGHLAVAGENGGGQFGPTRLPGLGGRGAANEAEAQVDGLMQVGRRGLGVFGHAGREINGMGGAGTTRGLLKVNCGDHEGTAGGP
jgi:hypothetical protein